MKIRPPKVLLTVLASSLLIAGMFFLFNMHWVAAGSANSLAETFAAAAKIYIPYVVRNKVPGASRLSGKIINDRTEKPLKDAVVVLDAGRQTTTDKDGEYWFVNVPGGTHQIKASKTDFITKTVSILVPSDSNVRKDVKMLPKLADGEMRLTVTWVQTPTWPPNNTNNDIDAHLWGPFTVASGYRHISFDNKGSCAHFEDNNYPCLEADADKGSGPESVIFYPTEGDYSFGVLNYNAGYTGVPPITQLGIKIKVEKFGESPVVYSVPTSGTGDFWYAFDIEYGNIVTEDLNCITNYGSGSHNEPPDCPTP